jgi:putative insertion element HTH domain-containing protein
MVLSSAKLEDAARMIAEDELSDAKISERIGVTQRTLISWKKKPEFAERVKEITAAYAARAISRGIAKRERRLGVLVDLHEKCEQVIYERSQSAELQEVAGGRTGLVTHNVKGVGKGDDFQLIDVYEVDTALLREMRAIQEQVAKELGQRVDKHELSGPNGDPLIPSLTVKFVNATDPAK